MCPNIWTVIVGVSVVVSIGFAAVKSTETAVAYIPIDALSKIQHGIFSISI